MLVLAATSASIGAGRPIERLLLLLHLHVNDLLLPLNLGSFTAWGLHHGKNDEAAVVSGCRLVELVQDLAVVLICTHIVHSHFLAAFHVDTLDFVLVLGVHFVHLDVTRHGHEGRNLYITLELSMDPGGAKQEGKPMRTTDTRAPENNPTTLQGYISLAQFTTFDARKKRPEANSLDGGWGQDSLFASVQILADENHDCVRECLPAFARVLDLNAMDLKSAKS